MYPENKEYQKHKSHKKQIQNKGEVDNSILRVQQDTNESDELTVKEIEGYDKNSIRKDIINLKNYMQENFTLLYGPFLWMGFNCLKATATSRRQFTFYHSVLRNSWYSFYRPEKDERLSQPWSHPVVLNTGPLDWESSALTTRPFP